MSSSYFASWPARTWTSFHLSFDFFTPKIGVLYGLLQGINSPSSFKCSMIGFNPSLISGFSEYCFWWGNRWGHPLAVPGLPSLWQYPLLEPHTWWPSPPVTGATVSDGHCHLSWEPQPIPHKQRALQAPLSVGPLGFFQPQRTLACSQDCPGAHTMPQLLEGIVSPGDSGEDICLLWFALCKKGPQVVLVSWCFIFSVGMRGGCIALLDLFPPINIINFLDLRLWDGSQVGSPAVLITAPLLLSWNMGSLLGPAPLVFLIPLEWDLSAINRCRQGLSPSSPVQQFQGLSKDKNVFESPLPPAVEGALLALEAGKPP